MALGNDVLYRENGKKSEWEALCGNVFAVIHYRIFCDSSETTLLEQRKHWNISVFFGRFRLGGIRRCEAVRFLALRHNLHSRRRLRHPRRLVQGWNDSNLQVGDAFAFWMTSLQSFEAVLQSDFRNSSSARKSRAFLPDFHALPSRPRSYRRVNRQLPRFSNSFW